MPTSLPGKIDRRVSRTRRNLQGSLLSLILEKGYDSVTVEEITNRADLGRTTFYLHYRDKEDLLMQAVQDLVDDLVSELSQTPFDNWKQRSRADSGDVFISAIALAFHHVAINADLYRVLLRGEGTYSALKRLRHILNDAISGLIQYFTALSQVELRPQVPMDVFLNGLAGAWIGLLTWWLEEDMPYSSEEMAVMFQRMFMSGTNEVLGLIENNSGEG
jgi:AcrR family transcriptional regulator